MWVPFKIPALFPGFVAHHTLALKGFNSLASAAPEPLSRRAEFLAGRWCASAALGEFSEEAAHCRVGMGADGAPIWPQGFVGSISHSRGLASAAVATTSLAHGIGFDIEGIMPEAVAIGVWTDIATSDEIELARAEPKPTIAFAATLLFSAKEAIFKCLYPIVGTYFDFRDVTAEHVDFGGGSIIFRLTSPFLVDRLGNVTLDCRFMVIGETILTGALLSHDVVAPARRSTWIEKDTHASAAMTGVCS